MEDKPIRLMDEVTIRVRDQVIGRGRVIGHAFDNPPRYDVVMVDGDIFHNLTPDRIDV
jgi:hypothetical protein